MYKLWCESGIRLIGDTLPLKGIIYGISLFQELKKEFIDPC